MRAYRTRGVVFLLLLGVLFCGPSPAGASDDVFKAFHAGMRNPDWKERRVLYLGILDQDGADAVDAVLAALMREPNPAVILEGIKTLGAFETEGARAALLEALEKARGRKAQYLLLALGEQRGPGGEEVLIGILRGKREPEAALAASALGTKASLVGVAPLVEALGHRAWQVVSAAARALRDVAGSARTDPVGPGKEPSAAMPAWFEPGAVLGPLVEALAVAEGHERLDLIDALEAITKRSYGYNVAAWRVVAGGGEPGVEVLARRVHPPYLCQVPVFGRRVVVVHDANVRTRDAQPFGQHRRLREVLEVPGGVPIPHEGLTTVQDFLTAQARRLIADLPKRGVRFEWILSGRHPQPAFGKLSPVNAGTRKSVLGLLERIVVQNEGDILSSMEAALDVGGSKDAQAWSRGPDEVFCMVASVPWLAAETDQEVIGAAVGLRARLRGVPVHAIGVREYPYQMVRDFARLSGGRLVEWTK